MALYDETEHTNPEQREKELAALKLELTTKYGPLLGPAVFEYTHSPYGATEQAQIAFSEVIATILESGVHLQKVQAIRCVLDMVDAKIEPVRKRANQAASNFDLY